MIAVTIADLLFRARQFLIAIVGVALVLAMALLLSGLANGFTFEIQQTVNGFGASNWVMADGAHGRVTSVATFSQSAAAVVRHEPGVHEAQPVVILPSQTTELGGKTATLNLAGVVPGALGSPAVAAGDGHGLEGPSQAVVDARLGAAIGSTFSLGSRQFLVVGSVSDRTLLGGVPMVYVSLPSAQAVALASQRLITAVVVSGTPAQVPSGLQVLTPQQVIDASLGQVQQGVSSINSSTILMWVIAAFIVAALLYVAALERRRDFAVLKALGASSGALFAGLMMEAIIVTLVAAAIAEVISNAMTFIFKQPVVIRPSAYIELPLIAIVVGLLASLVALRRTTRADPATAFG
jgi:putative ABC transport system permease protein